MIMMGMRTRLTAIIQFSCLKGGQHLCNIINAQYLCYTVIKDLKTPLAMLEAKIVKIYGVQAHTHSYTHI